MSFLIVLASLCFLMFVAYRGYSVILFAPIAAMGAVLLVRVPDLDLATLPPKILDNSVEQRGLPDPLAPEGDQKQWAMRVTRKMTVRHILCPLWL